MKVVVFGSTGLLGRAIVKELAARGHRVLRAGRRDAELPVDFRFDLDAANLRTVVRGADVVVNAVGILIERDGNTWDVVHRRAAQALAAACAAERVARIVHVSALGAGTGIAGEYMASKLAAEQAYESGPVDFAIVRPGLLVDPACPSTRLFRWLARQPVIALPGVFHPGESRVQPIQATDVAQCVARIAEHPKALRRVIELAGPRAMTYREMLASYRTAQNKGAPLWMPVPWWLMKLTARLARIVPQKVFSIDTMRMLQAGSVPQAGNEVRRWLGRDPLPLLPAGEPAPDAGLLASADVPPLANT
ncbi:NAD(P)H-binding protein [Ramlibacter sp. WS9]|uniref:NAD(P)H-binding protein n=1 Tax=Ramlibacter sp. WS9 TaxID=1882741 RepID=UPI001305280D|nr:NAD(P)H-binding protein [Ramlibacter sp. WS9]